MARVGINYEQVAAMANAIIAENQRPTIEGIRVRLGTGSPNTIHRHLTAWRGSQPQAQTKAVELPASIMAAITAEIERAKAAARAEIQTRLVETQAEAVELAATGEILEAEIDRLQEELAATEGKLKEKVTVATEQTWEIGSLKEQIQREQISTEHARLEQAKTMLNLEGFETKQGEMMATIERLEKLLTDEKQKAIAAEKGEAVALTKLESMTKQAKTATTSVESCNREKERLTKELSSASNQISAQQIALDAAAKEIDQAKQAAKEYRAEAKAAEEVAAELKGRLALKSEQTAKPKAVKKKAEPKLDENYNSSASNER